MKHFIHFFREYIAPIVLFSISSVAYGTIENSLSPLQAQQRTITGR